jgi:pimeloyl-ACP methyl ester carboxylesterase
MGLEQDLAAFAPRLAECAGGAVEYREAGPTSDAAPLVLLHGIGSGAGSWLRQLRAAAGAGRRVLAWNAPGYGRSARLAPESPDAADYAARAWAWLDTLGVARVTLVGHSLGALMAAAATRQQSERVVRLILLAPALGYRNAAPEVREQRLRERREALETLGPAGMAQKRGAAMLSPQASPEQVAFIQSVMAQIDPPGYLQAVRMLVGADLFADLAGITVPVAVASGAADTITPVVGCDRAAAAAGVSRIDLGPFGHACALEAADAVNALLGLKT